MAAENKALLSVLAVFVLAWAAAPLCARGPNQTTAGQTPVNQQTAPAAPPAPTAPAAPAKPPAGAATGTLGQVSATGSQKFTSAQIVAAAGLKTGETINRGDLQLAANRLARTGLFSSVNYRFSSQGANVDLQFQVVDAPTLHVSFDNFPWFTNEELSQDIRQSVGLFDGTAPKSGSYVDAIGTAIEKQLAALGVQGRVEHRLIERPVGTGMEVQFRLVGVTLKVGSVEFTDPIAQHDERVRERLEDLIGKPFSRYYTDVFVAEQVRPIYLSQGYLQAQFGSPEARFSGNPNSPNPGDVLIVVPVHPGKMYSWGGVRWSGDTVFSAQELNQMMGLHTGQTADGLTIEAGWQDIRQQYGAKGYLDASLDIRPSFDDAKSAVTYNVAITEGQPYRMGKLVISGLSVEAERRVRGAWLIHSGQTFDQDYFQDFLENIAKKALADLPVHYDHIGRYLQRNAKDHTVDVMLDFE